MELWCDLSSTWEALHEERTSEAERRWAEEQRVVAETAQKTNGKGKVEAETEAMVVPDSRSRQRNEQPDQSACKWHPSLSRSYR
jgi:hypothetical protein